MRIIERYIFGRAFSLFVGALASVLAIVWTTQALTRINLVTDSGQSMAAFLELATLILPSVIPEVVPFALAIAAAQVLTTMNSDSELVVMNAAGSSRLSVIRPILLLALLASALSFVFENHIDPVTKVRFRELLSNAHGNLISSVIQEGAFRKVDEGLYVQVGERLPDGRLGGLFVADSREEGTDLVYYAKRGDIVSTKTDSVLLMEDGEVHRKSASGDLSIIRFTSYAFNLAEFGPSSSGPVFFPKDRSIAYLLNPDADDVAYQQQPQSFRAELHRRLTEWTYPLVFALIALAVAGDARSHREARIHPMITALALALIVRWAGFFAGGRAQISAAWVPAMYLAPLIGAMLPIYFLLMGRTMELRSERIERVAAAIARRVPLFRRPPAESAT